MLVEHGRGEDHRADRFNGIDDRQAERKRSRVEGALTEQATEDAGRHRRVRFPCGQHARSPGREQVDTALGDRVNECVDHRRRCGKPDHVGNSASPQRYKCAQHDQCRDARQRRRLRQKARRAHSACRQLNRHQDGHSRSDAKPADDAIPHERAPVSGLTDGDEANGHPFSLVSRIRGGPIGPSPRWPRG